MNVYNEDRLIHTDLSAKEGRKNEKQTRKACMCTLWVRSRR